MILIVLISLIKTILPDKSHLCRKIVTDGGFNSAHVAYRSSSPDLTRCVFIDSVEGLDNVNSFKVSILVNTRMVRAHFL